MDKYVKVKQIGEGSFGKALLVKSKENGKQFVVKEINMGKEISASTRSIVDRLKCGVSKTCSKMSRKERDDARKETAVLAQLHHPNIVMYRESFEEIGHLYIVMDFCDGGDLYARINMQRGVLFPEDMILDWFVQTCLAVKHIHDRKILHRDIKSQNIFLTRHGIVKLGDFGIAKVLSSTVELARTCIGTPYYLSPEICENKPYNNKSDIWSLGCVLYEVTTLKHAFESGNMKNLVLKIIRGSYPPPSPRYSYELRNLIAALFRRNARDRPSITSVLRKPILQMRIRKFLSESEHEEEFSHTVMHGKKIQKALTPGARVFAHPPRPVAAKKTPVRATPRYDPASVYAPSVARRSKENARRSVDVKKSSGEKRPSSAGASTPDLVKRRKELIVKERKRREEEAKRKEQQYMRQHRDIIEKQRVARMMKAREEGWRCLMSSQESSSSDKAVKEELKRPSSAASPRPPAPAPRERGNYEAYHAWLDKQEEERKAAVVPPRPGPHLGVAGALGYQETPSPSPAVGGAIPSAQMAARQGEQARAQGADAAERARILEEYQLRKQQAAAYKARAQGNVFGTPAPKRAPPAPKPSAGRPSSSNSANQPTPASSRDGESEQDYLARLRQIRLQNFNERRMQKANQEAKADAKYKPSVIDQGNELRRKKIEALRAQAEDRANKLKADLERKRREAYDYEQRRLRNEGGRGRDAEKAQKPPLPAKPLKVIPLTEAMNAISASKVGSNKSEQVLKPAVGMTAAMQAIGASDSPPPNADKSSSPLQKRKALILKKLNAKPPWAPKQERPKWGEPVAMPAMERPHWNSGEKSSFSQLPLEETASHMEATNAGDLVVRHPNMAATPDIPVAPSNDQKEAEDQRKHWGGPAGTVLNVLQSAQLTDTATSDVSEIGSVEGTAPADPIKVAGDQDGSNKSKEEAHQTKAPVIGSTFTVIRNPLRGISVMQKVSPKKDSSNTDQTDAVEGTDSATESQSSPSAPEKAQEQEKPSSDSVRQDDASGDVDDREAEESVAEGSQVAPQQSTKEPDEKTVLFEKVQQKENDGVSVRSEVLQVEDVEEDEEAKTEEATEKTLTKDETEKKDSGMGEVTEGTEEKTDEATAAIDVEVKNLVGTTAGVLLGLTMGHFDAAINLLRTCSEPDLCKLSHSAGEADVISSISEAGLNDLDSDPSLTEVSSAGEVTDDKGKSSDDGSGSSSEPGECKLSEGEMGSTSPSREDKSTSEKEKERETMEEKDTDETETGKGERREGDKDEEVVEEDEEGSSRSTEDDDEIDTVRASMMLVLEGASVSDDEEEPLTARSTSKKTKEKKTKVKKTKTKVKATDAVDSSANRKWSASSMADLCSIRETMKGLLQPQPRQESKRTLPPMPDAGQGDADKSVGSPTPSFNVGESWQSDDDDDDDYFEEDDMFSRLEESRVKLEQELGCDVFLNAYKTVQKMLAEAIHEDEDENIEEGVRLVSQILGKDKEHLYPSILQLVMADGVFTEDND